MRYIQTVAFFSFILLISVLFYLTYNTFVLNERQYQVAEKNLLDGAYKSLIMHDNIYPGGYDVLNEVVLQNAPRLKAEYRAASSARNHYSDSTLNALFRELREKNSMDSIFRGMKEKYGLSEELEYLVTVNFIRISYKDATVFTFNQENRYSFLDDSLQTSYGYIIGGKLKTPLRQNLISGITVTSANDYSLELTFSFYADKNNRNYHIFKATLPALILALVASLLVIFIYYITFRSWRKVNRLAEMKSDFVDSITHEFHTPISTIIMANKNLQNDRVLADKNRVKELTDVIFRQSKRLEHLFGQVLDIARIENINLEKNDEDLNQLLEDIISDYLLKINDNNIGINFTKKENIRVPLNRFWFTTMLFNLFDNAIKYNDKPFKQINLDVVNQRSELQLRIADNGVGIEREMVTYIFDKFYRANKKEMAHISGLGLGLYYAQQCIRAHGWKMMVKSEINEGSEFTIFISKT